MYRSLTFKVQRRYRMDLEKFWAQIYLVAPGVENRPQLVFGRVGVTFAALTWSMSELCLGSTRGKRSAMGPMHTSFWVVPYLLPIPGRGESSAQASLRPTPRPLP